MRYLLLILALSVISPTKAVEPDFNIVGSTPPDFSILGGKIEIKKEVIPPAPSIGTGWQWDNVNKRWYSLTWIPTTAVSPKYICTPTGCVIIP